jgi:flagellar biosynthesis anti-sigma factor FlgM
MRIDQNGSIPRIQAVRSRFVGGLDEPPRTGADSVELSSRAADLRAAMEALQAAPAVREEQVARLREELEQGTFDPALGTLAAKLLPK